MLGTWYSTKFCDTSRKPHKKFSKNVLEDSMSINIPNQSLILNTISKMLLTKARMLDIWQLKTSLNTLKTNPAL